MRALTFALVFICCTSAPARAQRLPSVTPRRLLTVSNDELQLTYPGAAIVSPNGDLILADRPSKRLFLISPTGQLRGTLGGEGRAPGQLLSVGTLGVHGDSVLWAMDDAQSRLVRWSLTTLRHLSTQTVDQAVPGIPAANPGGIFSLDAAGNAVLGSSFRMTPGRPASGVGDIQLRTVNGTTSSLAQLEWRRSALVLKEGSMLTTQPFADNAVIAASGDGTTIYTVARSSSSEKSIALHRVEASSGRRDSVLLTLPPVPLSRPSVDTTISGLVGEYVESRSYRTTAEARADLRSALYIPAEWPPVTKMLTDSRTNTPWLFCRVAGKHPYVWRQVDMTRRAFTRQIDLPDNERLLAVDGEVLWTVRYEEDGDFSLSRWQLR